MKWKMVQIVLEKVVGNIRKCGNKLMTLIVLGGFVLILTAYI